MSLSALLASNFSSSSLSIEPFWPKPERYLFVSLRESSNLFNLPSVKLSFALILSIDSFVWVLKSRSSFTLLFLRVKFNDYLIEPVFKYIRAKVHILSELLHNSIGLKQVVQDSFEHAKIKSNSAVDIETRVVVASGALLGLMDAEHFICVVIINRFFVLWHSYFYFQYKFNFNSQLNRVLWL